MSGNASNPASSTSPAHEPALARVARLFPADLEVAAATAQSLRSGPPTPPQPAREPWPPMRLPK